MKGLIIYKSNYGATKQYAEWLNEETGFPIADLKAVKKGELIEADLIILGSPILAHTIPAAKWLTKHWGFLKDKKVVLYTTSGAAAADPELPKIFEASFAADIRQQLKYVPLGGRIIFSELRPFDRFLMKIGQKMEKDPIIKEEMMKDKDHLRREDIKTIIQYLK